MVQDFYEFFESLYAIGLCLMLSVVYVGSLHVWNSPLDRDHPSTIKKRFISVLCMMFIAPLFVYIGIDKNVLNKLSFLEILGIRTKGLCQAIVMPLFLTMILFLGPIVMKVNSGLLKVYTEPTYWLLNFKNLIWIRNHIIAPLSEEFTYRSCMLPVLLQTFPPWKALLISPLFFSVCKSPDYILFYCMEQLTHSLPTFTAHYHHMIERVKSGMEFRKALFIACFQMIYTSIFGMYSAYILLRTGHFISIVIVHSFCNHMGFPDFLEVACYKGRQKYITIGCFIFGFLSWCLLVKPLTESSWYHNDLTFYNLQ